MTAGGSTGVPLRQQIAEAIHKGFCDCSSYPEYCREGWPAIEQFQDAADAVVALLNLTEADLAGIIMWYFGTTGDGEDPAWAAAWAAAHSFLNDEDETPVPGSPGPWLPSTPPDTSSSEPA